MTLQALSDGHAPITMQNLFREAVYAFDEWDADDAGGKEPMVPTEAGPVAISEVFQHMRGCHDVLPSMFVGEVTARLSKPWEGQGPLNEMTFGTAARIMAVLVRKKRIVTGSHSPSATSPLDRPA